LILNRWSAEVRSLVALGLGALFWWLVLTLITVWWLPGGSYLFVWPTLFGVLGLGISMRAETGAPATRITSLLCATPALVLFPPLFSNMFDALSLNFALPGMVLVVLFLGTMLPALEPLIVPRPAWHQLPSAPEARSSAISTQ
jgi:hypothetical protein